MNHHTTTHPIRTISPFGLQLAIAVIALALRSPSAFANPEPDTPESATPESAIHTGLAQLAQGKSDDAIKSFALAESLDNGKPNPVLRERARFNTALAHFTANRPDDAAKIFSELASSTRDAALAASSQYQLGLIEHGHALKTLESTDKDADQADRALEQLRRAERHFRNAQGDDATATDARRNIDLTQRLIAAVQKQKDQQQQQQQDNKQDPQKNDQEQNTDQKSDQSKPDQSKQDQSKQDQSKQNQSKSDQSKQDQSDENSQQQASGDPQKKPQQKKNKDSQKQDQRDPKPDEQSEQEKANQAKADQAKADQQQAENERREQEQRKDGEATDPARPFDLTAAQILDKERRERAALERILRQLSGRPARVEKDW